MDSYPRETKELVPVTVTVDGVAQTASITFAVVANGARPVTWLAPVTVGSTSGVLIDTLAPGVWRVFAKVTSAPEIPVIDCGAFQVN